MSHLKAQLAYERQSRADRLRQLLQASLGSSVSGTTAASASVATSEDCWLGPAVVVQLASPAAGNVLCASPSLSDNFSVASCSSHNAKHQA